jgi:hypothetical protein
MSDIQIASQHPMSLETKQRSLGFLVAVLKAGSQRFSGPVTLECTGGGSSCAFTGAQQLWISDGGTRVTATWDTWSRPTTWKLTARVQEYRLVGDVPWKGEVTAVRRGEVVPVDYPRGSTVKVLRIKTFTHQEYQLTPGSIDPMAILQYKGAETNAPETVDRLILQAALQFKDVR